MRLAATWLVLLLSCSGAPSADAGIDVFGAAGPYGAGSRHLTVVVDGGRALPVELWYPTHEASSEFAVSEFEEGPRRATLEGWIAQAPAACTPRRARSARDARAIDHALPLLVFSHCTECFRFSLHTVAERLATHGFAVAAADHVENTRFDATAPLNDAFLSTRAADVSGLVDFLTSEKAPLSIDSSRIAAFGHSFGAVTTARAVERDPRLRAGFLIAAPADSPLLNSGALPRIGKPLSFLLAKEDNSITSFGNELIRDNFRSVVRPTWLIEVENAGHWSFSDIANLGGDYRPGCGEGVRELDGGTFSYLDNDVARAIAARSVTAWAAFTLRDDTAAASALSEATPAGVVSVRKRGN